MALSLPPIGLSAVIDNMDNFNRSADDITSAYDRMDEGADSVASSSSGLSSILGGLGSILSTVVVAAAAAAAAALATIVAGLAAVTAAAINVAQDMESASNAIIIGTGASGQALKEMEQSVRNLSESGAGVRFSYEQIGGTMAEVNTRLGITGDTLEGVTGKILDFSRLTGGDPVTNVQLLTRVMGDWGVETEDTAGLLDMIFGAGQAFGIGVDDLSRKVVQFGAPLRQMGFSLEESIALFGKWEKEGVNAELAIGSLRIAAGKFANENIPLRDGLNQTMEAIKGAGTESEALAIAMDVFGARAGPDMAAAIREGRFELEGAIQALQGTSGGLDDAASRTLTLGDQMGIMWNKIRNSLLPFGDALLDVADYLLPLLDSALATLAPQIEYFADLVGDTLRSAIGEFMNSLGEGDSVLTAIKNALLDFLPEETVDQIFNFIEFLGQLWEAGKAFAGFVMNTLVPAMISIYDVIANDIIPFIQELWDLWSKDSKKAGKTITKIFEDVSDAIEPIVKKILPALLELWDVILKWTKKNWPLIQEVIEDVMKDIGKIITDVLDEIQKFWDRWGDEIMEITEFVFDTIFKLVKLNLENMLDIITVILKVIQGDWKGAWETMKDIVERTVKAIVDIVGDGFGTLKSIIADTLDDARKAVVDAWNNIVNAIENAIDDIVDAVQSGFGRLPDIIKSFGSQMYSAARDIMQQVINGINSMLSSIASSLQSVISNAISQLSSAISGSIGSTLRNIGRSIIDQITAGINAVTTFASNLISKISGWLSQVAGTTWTAAKSIANSIMQQIQSGIATFSGFASYIKDRIESWMGSITSFGSAVYNVGRTLVQRVLDGVGSMASNFISWVRQKFEDWMDSLFSPIPSARHVGQELVENVLMGVGAQGDKFISTLRDQIDSWMRDTSLAGSLRILPEMLGDLSGIPLANAGITRAPVPVAAGSPGGGASYTTTNYNTFNTGGNTLSSDFDAALFEQRVINVIRSNLR